MTDITELAQSLKRRATSAKEFGESLYVKADDVIALVEALEKAQATEAHCNRGWREAHEQEARAEAAEKRIAELESRTVTVKLPQRYSMLFREGFSEDYRTEIAYSAEDIQEMLTAAGIKWEAE